MRSLNTRPWLDAIDCTTRRGNATTVAWVCLFACSVRELRFSFIPSLFFGVVPQSFRAFHLLLAIEAHELD